MIQKVYTHFKKAPGTHKLGVLYVVDSVTRQWVDQARKAGQAIGSSAADGTFAAGVNHVTELLPSFMTDIINNAPEEQKVRLLDKMLKTIVSLDHIAAYNQSVTIAAISILDSKNSPSSYCIDSELTYLLHLRKKLRSSLIFGNVGIPSQQPCYRTSKKN